MKQLRNLQNRFTPTAAKWRWVFLPALIALTGVVAALACWVVDTQSFRAAISALGTAKLWYTALMVAGLCGVFGLLTRSLFVGGLVSVVPVMFLFLVNYFKLAITSTPLQLTEFALITRLGDITSLNAASIRFSRNSILAIIGCVIWLLILLFFSRPLRPKWRFSLPACLIPALMLVLVFRVGADKLVYTPLGVPFSDTVNQSHSNENCGVLLGLWRTCIQQMDKPLLEDYNERYLAYLLDGARQELPAVSAEERELPNIILILSESFFDVTELPGVTFETDPLAQFHALQAEGVSGSFHTRTLGYGTCNIELEILTGVNTTLLNREDLYSMDPNLLTRLPNVPTLLKQAGYDTVMLHMFNDEIYHRGPILKTIGFDETYFSGDFAQIDPEAASAPNYWAFMEQQIDGSFYSDAYMTDLFIDLYEAGGEAPQFLYGISMESHTPHDGTKYVNDGYTVSFTSPLKEEDAAILRDCAQGAANASAALGRLCDYFREQEEPTVILFYGDHRPNLGLANATQTVFSRLGLSGGINQGEWSVEELARLHSTSYLIWANDPDYLPAPAGTVEDTSSNYFGLSILDSAGVEKPLYWRLLEQANETRLIDTLEYHLGRDGSLSRSDDLLTALEQERLSRLSLFLHDAIRGKQYVTEQLWE